MKAAVLKKVGQIKIEEREKPSINDDQVLIKIHYTGICGSDIHYYEHGRIGDFVVNDPIILGHESSGQIVKKGKNVQHLKINDEVTIEPGYACNECMYCKKGQYNLCDQMVFMATPPVDGSFCEYVAYPAHMVYKLPESVSLKEGALVEPLSIGIYSAIKAKVEPGKKVLILGAGTIGLVTLMACQAYGASLMDITDINAFRLEKAKKIGANQTINVSKEKVKTDFYDIVIDCVGIDNTVDQAIHSVTKGGCILFVGMGSDDKVGLDINKAIVKEIRMDTIFRYKNVFPIALELLADQKIELDHLITHAYTLDEIQEAFEFVKNHKEKVLKAVIKI